MIFYYVQETRAQNTNNYTEHSPQKTSIIHCIIQVVWVYWIMTHGRKDYTDTIVPNEAKEFAAIEYTVAFMMHSIGW